MRRVAILSIAAALTFAPPLVELPEPRDPDTSSHDVSELLRQK